MKIEVRKVELKKIRHLRTSFLKERNIQFICDKCHLYGWADTYLIIVEGNEAGYASVWGTDSREIRDTVFEFYLREPNRGQAREIFSQLLLDTGASGIEAQTNDPLLTSMLLHFSSHIITEAILFEDHEKTSFSQDGVVLKRVEDEGNQNRSFVLEKDGVVVASGGLMLNYNHPFADLYMDVREQFRNRGFGVLIIQYLKEFAYQIGRIPAARCNVQNNVSQKTLVKAGFKVCGYRLKGIVAAKVKQEANQA